MFGTMRTTFQTRRTPTEWMKSAAARRLDGGGHVTPPPRDVIDRVRRVGTQYDEARLQRQLISDVIGV